MAVEFSEGTPCWYELSTSDLAAAGEFYNRVLGWSVTDAGMEGFTYHLATATDGAMVAGMSSTDHQDGSPPPSWLIYFTSSNVDDRAASIEAAGGSVLVPPSDIPGTGRFAVCTDPQGAAFGLLQPLPMDEPPAQSAFDMSAQGHGAWHELMSSDPAAGFGFYAEQFGWTKGEAMDMGDMGTYQLFQNDGSDIGGMMGLGDSPVSVWLPYFGTGDIDEAIGRINDAGGSIHLEPVQVPGGVWITVAQDPQDAWFALLGSREVSE